MQPSSEGFLSSFRFVHYFLIAKESKVKTLFFKTFERDIIEIMPIFLNRRYFFMQFNFSKWDEISQNAVRNAV